jgi:hypothetical protein
MNTQAHLHQHQHPQPSHTNRVTWTPPTTQPKPKRKQELFFHVKEATRKDPKGNKDIAEKAENIQQTLLPLLLWTLLYYPKQIRVSGRSRRRPQ